MPGIAPLKLTIRPVPLSSTTAYVSWTTPSLIYHNGIIRGYRLKYFLVDQPQNVIVIDAGNKTQILLQNLQTLQNYSVQVAAYNSIGIGPYSRAIIYQSHESGKIQLQLNKVNYKFYNYIN